MTGGACPVQQISGAAFTGPAVAAYYPQRCGAGHGAACQTICGVGFDHAFERRADHGSRRDMRVVCLFFDALVRAGDPWVRWQSCMVPPFFSSLWMG